MEWRKITAILRCNKLEEVQRRLLEMGVPGITINQVKGCGEYVNFFNRNMTVTHTRIEVFCPASKTEEIAQAVMESAHTGSAGDGIMAILPVERIYRIRSKAEPDDKVSTR
jgi:nitrogen regulatory protein P-II 1